MEKKNTGLIILVIILSLLVVGLGGFIIYDKVLSNNEVENNNNNDLNDDVNNNVVDNTNNSNENLNSIGLDLYKLFTGNGTGPFKWENGEVVNYVNVITHMTQDYFDLPADDKGFSIPYKDGETGKWLSYGGWGTDRQSKFKSIAIEKQEENTITFKITYQYTQMGTQSTNPTEDTDTFVIKKIDGIWKVDRFQLIYGIEF